MTANPERRIKLFHKKPSGLSVRFPPYEETLDRIRRYRRHYEKHGFGKCIILDKGTNRPLGDAGLAVLEDTGETQVGYKLARAYWGHGFATAGATALTSFGLTQLELPRIGALIHPANVPSTRVADKTGFRYCRTNGLSARHGAVGLRTVAEGEHECR